MSGREKNPCNSKKHKLQRANKSKADRRPDLAVVTGQTVVWLARTQRSRVYTGTRHRGSLRLKEESTGVRLCFQPPVQTWYAALETQIPNCLSKSNVLSGAKAKSRRLAAEFVLPQRQWVAQPEKQSVARPICKLGRSTTQTGSPSPWWNAAAATIATRKMTFMMKTRSPHRKIKHFCALSGL